VVEKPAGKTAAAMSEPEPQELGAEVVSGSVATSDDGQEMTKAKYTNLCRELNMDRQTELQGYQMYHEVSQRCSLEVSGGEKRKKTHGRN